jgi:glyceraldehyde 3-phosphate dehydrogenase
LPPLRRLSCELNALAYQRRYLSPCIAHEALCEALAQPEEWQRWRELRSTGLGRIGRTFLKLAIDHPALDVVAANDIADPNSLVYLLKYDSAYGRYTKAVGLDSNDGRTWLRLGEHRVELLHERDPASLPWRALSVDIVVEATGVFETYADARAHLHAGAAHVVLTAPAKDEDTDEARTILMGVNPEALRMTRISSNGSCTTNSAASVVEVLRQRIGVRKAILNTVHGYTATQTLVDSPVRGRDLRRGRAAAANIVPATTGAAIAVARAIPELRGRFDGVAIRVPVLTGSLSSIVFLADRETSVEEINNALQDAARDARWSGVLTTVTDPLVSSDIVGDPHGAVVDLSLTKVIDGDLCAVYSWYDNEFGFTSTLLAHVVECASLKPISA